jgi:hypothetical protein
VEVGGECTEVVADGEVAVEPALHAVGELAGGDREQVGIDVGRLARPGVVDERDPCRAASDSGTVVLADQVEREVVHGAEGAGRRDPSLGDDQLVAVHVGGGIAPGEVLGEEPRGGRPPAVEQARLGEQERAHADPDDRGAGCGGRVDHLGLHGPRREDPVELRRGADLEARDDEDVDGAHGVDRDPGAAGGEDVSPGGHDGDVVPGARGGTGGSDVARHREEVGNAEHLGGEAAGVGQDPDADGCHRRLGAGPTMPARLRPGVPMTSGHRFDL